MLPLRRKEKEDPLEAHYSCFMNVVSGIGGEVPLVHSCSVNQPARFQDEAAEPILESWN